MRRTTLPRYSLARRRCILGLRRSCMRCCSWSRRRLGVEEIIPQHARHYSRIQTVLSTFRPLIMGRRVSTGAAFGQVLSHANASKLCAGACNLQSSPAARGYGSEWTPHISRETRRWRTSKPLFCWNRGFISHLEGKTYDQEVVKASRLMGPSPSRLEIRSS